MSTSPESIRTALVLRYPQFAGIDPARLEAFAVDALDYLPAGVPESRHAQALMCKAGSLLIESLKLAITADGAVGQVKRLKEADVEIEFFGGSSGAALLQNALEAQFKALTEVPPPAQKLISPYVTGMRRRGC